MRNSILFLTALAAVLTIFSAKDCLSATSSGSNNSFGFSSEDWGGDTSYLGIDTRDITADRLSALHLKEERGVEITMVDQDAPAGKAGLKEQDVIVNLNGEKVESVEQLRRMIHETPAGRVISLGVSRNGQPLTIKVQLSERKKNFAYAFGPNEKEFKFTMPAIPPMPDIDIPVSIVVAHSSARSGLMVENITPQLGEFFGIKDGNGVLVRSVEKGSRAEKAGLRAGDVIVKINGTAVHDTSDFTHSLRARKENAASIGILRDKKEQTITLTLPDRKESELRESFEIPEINAETQEELSNLSSELAEMKPHMEEAINREMARMKPELERQKREFVKRQTEMHKQMQEAQREIQKQQQQIQKDTEEALHSSGTRI
jgi:serine protease Do